MVYYGNWLGRRRDNALFDKMAEEKNLDSPRPFASFTDEELPDYAGVFIPGGHAPIRDLGDNSELGRIMWHFHNFHKPTGTSSVRLSIYLGDLTKTNLVWYSRPVPRPAGIPLDQVRAELARIRIRGLPAHIVV